MAQELPWSWTSLHLSRSCIEWLKYVSRNVQKETRSLHLGQCLKSREVVQVQMSLLLFDLFPQFLYRVVVWRIGRQLDDVKSCCPLGKEGFGLSVFPGSHFESVVHSYRSCLPHDAS
jgi:hypothetical protein